MCPASQQPPAQHGDAAPPDKQRPHKEAWQPRMPQEEEFNSFTNTHRSPDITPAPQRISDPREDTAPLQGEHDLSDEDSVVPDPPDSRSD